MTNLIDALHIPDTQSARDDRHLAIQRVGVRGVRYPIQLRIEGAVVPTVADWSLDVALPAEQKGTHMSRFVAWLDAIDDPLDAATLRREATRMLALLGADAGRIEASFPFFLQEARAGLRASRACSNTRAGSSSRRAGDEATVWVEVVVPVKSLCPCSKEISDYGAHNQRSHVTIRVEALAELSWLELVRFAEDSASAEIWSSLKRADEKWITERAYENPKFVEDMVRDVALKLNADARIGRYTRRRRELRVDPRAQRDGAHRALTRASERPLRRSCRPSQTTAASSASQSDVASHACARVARERLPERAPRDDAPDERSRSRARRRAGSAAPPAPCIRPPSRPFPPAASTADALTTREAAAAPSVARATKPGSTSCTPAPRTAPPTQKPTQAPPYR